QFVSTTPDLSLEQVEESRERFEKYRDDSKIQRALLDIICAEILDESLRGQVQRNIPKLEAASREGMKPELWADIDSCLKISRHFNVFHWELEFPEAFANGKPLFDLVIANPPWGEIRPYD